MRYPKQVSFDEDGTVLVGGSDHGAVYIFVSSTLRQVVPWTYFVIPTAV